MQPNKLLLLLILLLLLMAGLLQFAAAGDQTLFTDPGNALSQSDLGTVQAKVVVVNLDVLNNGRTPTIKINLFDDLVITAVRSRRDPSTAEVGYIWVGRIQDEPYSSVTLSVVDEVLVGSIQRQNGDHYEVKYKNGTQILRQIDPSAQIEVEGPDTIDAPLPNLPPAARHSNSLCEDGSQIDLLVAYTAGARNWEGGQAAIEALINQRISEMNSANSNSGLPSRYRLVRVMQTNYAETGNVLLDLPRLRTHGDGYLDDVTAARESSLADMAALLIGQSTTGNTCGAGYVMNSLSTSFASSAFNVTALDYIGDRYTCNYLTLAHEFGHNMGNLHDRENNSSRPLLPYAFGYRPPSSHFRTIMAYNCPVNCPRVQYWSNPDVTYMGEATGIDHNLNPAHSADNARSMEQTSLYVANFRQNCPAPTATPTPTGTPQPTATPTIMPTATVNPALIYRDYAPYVVHP
jgi:peptidyl-Asp metalloendopeptidase